MGGTGIYRFSFTRLYLNCAHNIGPWIRSSMDIIHRSSMYNIYGSSDLKGYLICINKNIETSNEYKNSILRIIKITKNNKGKQQLRYDFI